MKAGRGGNTSGPLPLHLGGRIGIRGYIPGLQYEGAVLRFLLDRGYRIPSPAGLVHNHDRLVSELEDLVAASDLPVVRSGHRPQPPSLQLAADVVGARPLVPVLLRRRVGPAFLKICAYAPYPLWACANGHEWAKCQLAKAGVGFEALDNGLRAVAGPAVARSICARLGSGHVRDLLRRMMAVMPDP